ncbi:lysine N(6)-hydroxylase/L-ornithine N(5)-oxygenase family protein [Actinokineospora enzanensis]|uniref:lysine N(6)-hydroxylase/L-ornithine N(5)-oxygenase family protein n=1 Tax=Actinokineospora enzanensis TaxID=155975 RepID=UPI00036E7F23|nr:SidA/IucD/PvdA family monooxygenase [Actinokineospora enzanensis]
MQSTQSTPLPSPRGPHFGCVGVGVGPANLSLAALLHGRPETSSLFLDAKPTFAWHDNQQIPGASLQVSLFKDLVTLADPTNRFSFLAYLHSQGRIYHFVNAQFDAMPRREFRNYLRWVCENNENVLFGERVREVGFDGVFVLRTDKRTITADNVVLGIGIRPWVPEGVADLRRDTQFHVNDHVIRAADLAGRRVAIIGGGQSGAEAFLDLVSRPADRRPARVSWVSRRANFFPIDDTPFTNDFFMPGFSDHFAGLERIDRAAFNAAHVLASDGISAHTLRAIYQRCYELRFIDGERDPFALYPGRSVTSVLPASDGGWELVLEPATGPPAVERLGADTVVWATGFRPQGLDLLAPIADRLRWEGEEPSIDQDFAVRWDGPAEHNIFVQNGARAQRGLADPNLSLIAWRSQRIVDRILGRKSDEQAASFLRWSSDPALDGVTGGA